MSENQNNKPKGNKDNKNDKKKQLISTGTIVLIALVFTYFTMSMFNAITTKEIKYSEFLKLLDQGMVSEVIIKEETIDGKDVKTVSGLDKIMLCLEVELLNHMVTLGSLVGWKYFKFLNA